MPTTLEVGVLERYVLFVATCVLGLVGVIRGAHAQVIREISLDEALQLFNDNNLRLRLSRSEAAVVMGNARQASSFPNPTGELTHEQISNQGLTYSETYFSLRQALPLPWLLPARSTARDALITGAAAAIGADSNQLQLDMKRLAVRAIAAERQLRVVNDVVQTFRAVEQAAAARFAEGDVSGYDLRRIRIELARYEQIASGAQVHREDARGRLTTALLPDTRDTVLAPSDFLSGAPPPFDLPDLYAHALAHRPEVVARQADITAASAQRRMARSGRWVDRLVLTGGYKRQSDGFDGPFLGAELPLPLWTRQGGAVAASDAQLSAAQERARLTERVILDDVRQATRAYASTVARVERTEQRLYESTADLLNIARASYDDGEMDLLDLLDAADAFFSSRTDQIELRAELWERYFDLDRAIGGFDRTLPARGELQ